MLKNSEKSDERGNSKPKVSSNPQADDLKKLKILKFEGDAEKNGDQTHADGATHPTVGNDTLSDDNLETLNEKTETRSIYEIKNECEEKDDDDLLENKSATEFLKEINTLNDNLVLRKKEIKDKIAALTKELDVLNSSKSTPGQIVNYINTQRTNWSNVVHSLKTGSSKFDRNVPSNLLPPISKSIEEEEMELMNKRVPYNERVFVTKKTQGFKKEQEKNKKRDIKY